MITEILHRVATSLGVVIGFVAVVYFWFWYKRTIVNSTSSPSGLYCGACHYPLAGREISICPECGTATTDVAPATTCLRPKRTAILLSVCVTLLMWPVADAAIVSLLLRTHETVSLHFRMADVRLHVERMDDTISRVQVSAGNTTQSWQYVPSELEIATIVKRAMSQQSLDQATRELREAIVDPYSLEGLTLAESETRIMNPGSFSTTVSTDAPRWRLLLRALVLPGVCAIVYWPARLLIHALTTIVWGRR